MRERVQGCSGRLEQIVSKAIGSAAGKPVTIDAHRLARVAVTARPRRDGARRIQPQATQGIRRDFRRCGGWWRLRALRRRLFLFGANRIDFIWPSDRYIRQRDEGASDGWVGECWRAGVNRMMRRINRMHG